MKQRLHKKIPSTRDIPETIDFIGLYYDCHGFRIQVADLTRTKKPILEIDFGKTVLAHRSMDEGKFLNLSWKTEEAESTIGAIVIVENSDFIEWFHQQSCNIYKEDQILHFAILTQNEWVEVLTLEIPKIQEFRGVPGSASKLNNKFRGHGRNSGRSRSNGIIGDCVQAALSSHEKERDHEILYWIGCLFKRNSYLRR
jgi:hypothetical protein